MALVVLAAGVLVSACGSGGPGGSGGSGGAGGFGGGTGLTAALSRVADTGNTRSQIYYDHTAALVAVAGKRLSAAGYSTLVGMGAGALQADEPLLQSQAGIQLTSEQYAISAGSPPRVVGFLAGGQNAAQVTRDLTRQGWKRRGDLLVMLPLNLLNSLDGSTGGALSLVEPTGSDVIYGNQRADLSEAEAPSGTTLAQDPLVSALATCLGNVAAAEIVSGYPGPAVKPAELAVGVSTPASNSAAPHVVACAAWSSPGAASGYAANLRRALSSGSSVSAGERWSALLRHASVTSIGGRQNVVGWQAQAPGRALAVFQLIDNEDLPALPDCGRLSRAAAARVIGC